MLLVGDGGSRDARDAIRPRHRKRWKSRLYMDGPSLIGFTVDAVPQMIDQILREQDLKDEDISQYLMHQATWKMLDQLRIRMGVAADRLPIELSNVGNTVSCTLPILIDQLRKTDRIERESVNMLVGFGVGLSWAGCLWKDSFRRVWDRVTGQREMDETLSGKLLIASPYLSDPNFLRSVVLVVNHSEEGAFGLSLNRPTQQRLSQVVEMSLPNGSVRDDDYIFEGGPVADGPLLALHDLPDIGTPIGDASARVWLTDDEDHLRMLLTRVDACVRFLVQYSGWGPGQLDREMECGGWLVGNADHEVVFEDPEQVWEAAVNRCGREVLSALSPGLRFHDPSVN